MTKLTTLLLAGGATALVASCEHGGTKEAAGSVAEPMIGAAEVARTAHASVSIGLKNGAPYFASSGYGYQVGGGGDGSGITLGTGDLDISVIPPGDVNFTISLNDDAWNAGYRFPSDAYQAIAIAYWAANSPTPPTPVFGQANWPAEFDAPAVSGERTLTFVDKDDDDSAYEYSVAVNGPGGRVVLDPKITNGGHDK